jgi:hypothetical protein
MRGVKGSGIYKSYLYLWDRIIIERNEKGRAAGGSAWSYPEE